jgi:hypothetical protein
MKNLSKFDCIIRAAVPEEASNLLSVASLEKLRNFLPEISAANDDLLPIALDACVVNQFNKNGDGIDSSMAYAIYKNFAFKPINIEHEPKKVIGTILSASFLDMDHNEIDAEKAKEMTGSFYITLGGVLWKRVNPNVTAFIEDCSDPTSPNYKEVSGSWELAFSDYKLMAGEDECKDMAECDELEEMDELAASRKYPGKKIYRKLIGETLPIGLGIVEYPAANVKGIATNMTVATNMLITSGSNDVKADDTLKLSVEDLTNTVNKIIGENTLLASKISHLEKNNVTTIKSTMKISDIKQITDESLKGGVITASAVQEFISDLEKANEDYKGKQSAAEAFKKSVETQKELLEADLKSTKAALDTMKSEVDTLKNKIQAEEAQKSFSARMAYFDESYALSAEVKKVLAQKLKLIASDTEFETFKSEMEVFLVKKDSTSTASEEVIDEALKGKKSGGLPNGTESKEKISELNKAWALEEFIIET